MYIFEIFSAAAHVEHVLSVANQTLLKRLIALLKTMKSESHSGTADILPHNLFKNSFWNARTPKRC